MKKAWEVNFDGMVGPTHNYAGLSYGNVASMRYGETVSNPREAALQGLKKMRLLMDLGVKQGVLPPQERPHIATLRRVGFAGSDEEVLALATKEAPDLLTPIYSASSMWAANAATVSPSYDSADGRVHLTPANLMTHLHRSLEPPETARILRTLFPDQHRFSHHPPLPEGATLCDEGAANHLRLCPAHNAPGVEVFVYGRTAFRKAREGPTVFPARQTREASEAVARLHRLDPARTMFVRQNPDLIDAGVFHNDVISVANERVLFYHNSAFAGGGAVVEEIKSRLQVHCGCELSTIEVNAKELSPAEAVTTYLFNSQIVTLPGADMAFVAPTECEENPRTRAIIERILAEDTNPIRAVHYVNIRQSMKNGGGAACLRRRIVLNQDQMESLHPGVLLTQKLYDDLRAWIVRHYRSRLTFKDLADPALLAESCSALDELTQILDLGSIYDFQQ